MAYAQSGYDPAYNPETAEYKRRMAAEAKNTNSSVLNQYASSQAQMPVGISNQIDYTKGLSTAYTPEQELAMRNRIRATDTAQNTGAMGRIRDYMASIGQSGGGQEQSAIMGMMRDQNATRQGALSDLDINNATLGLQNQYQKAGMLNSLAGMGEQARQFDTGQANNMFQWGKTFDWEKLKDEKTRSEYQRQLDELLGTNKLGSDRVGFGSRSSNTSNNSGFGWR